MKKIKFHCVFLLLLIWFCGTLETTAQNYLPPNGGGFPDPQLSQKDNDYLNRQAKVFLDTVQSILSDYPPILPEGRERGFAKLLIDAVFHERYAAFRKPAQAFFHAQTNQLIKELEEIKVENGAKIWKVYNMGFIVRTKSVTLAFDIVRGATSGSADFTLSTDEMDRIVKQCDVLFISHKHADHADKEVAEDFIRLGRPVVAPEQVWKDDPVFSLITHLDRTPEKVQKLKLSDNFVLDVIIYPGHQLRSADNNVALVNTPEGITVAHLGDQINEGDFMIDYDWIDKIAQNHHVDILMPNAWTMDISRIVRGFNPELVVPGHELELGHTVWDRLPYWGDDEYLELNYSELKASGYPVLVMVWGESYQYDPKPIYLDYNQSFKVRVDDLLSRMTLQEKLSQMMTRTPTELMRFGIPGYQWGGEAGHCVIARSGDVATIFPQAIAQAATWNKRTVYEVANAMSDESRARVHAGIPKTGLTFWAPVVEMARDPRWGRTEECYGEDPYLTSQLSLAFVKGLQGDHPKYLKTIAAPKHFAANNEEWCRHNGSSEIDEQLLHEYYLRPYQVLVEEGKVEQIMAAYNRLNGVPCAGNKLLLTDILRNDWGFDGTVVSDCNGIKDLYEGHKYVANVEEAIALALNSGLDLECGDCFKASLAEAVKKGLVSAATIDTAVHRILLSRFRLGLYDPPEMVPYTKIPHTVVDGPENRALARKAAREAIVLLKNENHLLPLNIKEVKSVAVIGPNAAVCQMGGYTGAYSKAVSPIEGIINRLDNAKVHYVKGTDIKISLPVIPNEYLVPPDAKPGEHGLRGEYFNNTDCSGDPVLVRIDPVIDFNFGRGAPDPAIPIDYYSVRWTGRFIAPASGTYFIGGDFDDAIRLYLDGKKIIDKTNNRNRSSDAVKIELEAGKQYDLRIEYTEQWYNAAVKLWGAPQNPDKFKEAVDAARNAEVAIVVLGTDESVEKEGVDRSDLDLPGDQEELVKAVYQANPKTIVVLQNGSALSINWLKENVPAILETWYNGEEAGNALADVIFGDYNPGGRLPLTFYKSAEQFPSISDYDIRKGRTYLYPNSGNDKSSISEPLYSFGYGLSYTQFSYGPLQVISKKIDAAGSVIVKISMKNIGDRFGDEVVQLYARDEKSSVRRPDKQLVGFERISLQPNEIKTVEFVFPAKDLAYWDVNKKSFIVEPGVFTIMAGSSSADIRSTGKFRIKAISMLP